MVATPEDREEVRTGDAAGAPAAAPTQAQAAVGCDARACEERAVRTVDLAFIDDGPVQLCGEHYEELATRVRQAGAIR